MPIYAYRCESCGFGKDVLQKMSDPLLTQCPECGKDTFRKQVTAAGFQLKGSGWYVTDFRSGNSGAKAPAKPDANGAADGATNGGAGENAAAADNGAAKSDTASAGGTAAASSNAAAAPAAPAASPSAPASSSGSGSA